MGFESEFVLMDRAAGVASPLQPVDGALYCQAAAIEGSADCAPP